MSMSVIVGNFNKIENRLSSEYESKSGEVVVTEYIDSLLSDYVTEFEAFEDDESIVYKEINSASVIKISEVIDSKFDDLIEELEKTSGHTKKKELLTHIKDLHLINSLIKRFLILSPDSQCNIKLLIV